AGSPRTASPGWRAARYRARLDAEREVVAYLRGIVDALDIAPDTVEGFDDETGELLIADPPDKPPTTE
ncbi:MAG: hypothetical protein ABIO65_05275, partial [Nitrospiria bacterium]